MEMLPCGDASGFLGLTSRNCQQEMPSVWDILKYTPLRVDDDDENEDIDENDWTHLHSIRKCSPRDGQPSNLSLKGRRSQTEKRSLHHCVVCWCQVPIDVPFVAMKAAKR